MSSVHATSLPLLPRHMHKGKGCLLYNVDDASYLKQTLKHQSVLHIIRLESVYGQTCQVAGF